MNIAGGSLAAPKKQNTKMGQGFLAMEQRLAGATKNKPMKPPKAGGKQFGKT